MQVSRIDPDDPWGWGWQVALLADLGRIDEALAASARAVEFKLDDPDLNRLYAWRLRQAERFAEAREYREKAIDLAGEPETAADWDQRGNDLGFMDQHDEALIAFRQALALEPRRIAVWNHLFGLLQEQGRYRLFHRAAERAADLMPQEPKLHSYLGTGRPW